MRRVRIVRWRRARVAEGVRVRGAHIARSLVIATGLVAGGVIGRDGVVATTLERAFALAVDDAGAVAEEANRGQTILGEVSAGS